jgi:hypothetical protein
MATINGHHDHAHYRQQQPKDQHHRRRHDEIEVDKI